MLKYIWLILLVSGFTCQICKTGSYIEETCKPCHLTCSECFWNYQLERPSCHECQNNHYQSSTRKNYCGECAHNCEKCLGPFEIDCIKVSPRHFYLEETAKINQCSYNCLKCKGFTECEECDSGYYLSKTPTGIQCLSCKDSSCIKCEQVQDDKTKQPIIKCNQCMASYFQNPNQKNKCDICSNYCLECESKDKCTKCLSGYKLEKDQCVQCDDKNCAQCDQNINQCLKCVSDSYFLSRTSDSETICKLCPLTHCAICKSDTECQECKPGYFYNSQINACEKCQVEQCSKCSQDGKKCMECVPGLQFNEKLGICDLCPVSCLTCKYNALQEKNECTKCKQGWHVNSDSKCVKCFKGCVECRTSDKNTCIECAIGYRLIKSDSNSREGTCVLKTCKDPNNCLECPSGQYYNKEKNECQSCNPSTCAQCKGPGENSCEMCASGLILQNLQRLKFDQDQIILVGQVQDCRKDIVCHNTCEKCSNSSFLACDSCAQGLVYNEKNGVCYDFCDNQQYFVPEENICKRCKITHCEKCKGPNTCSICSLGYTLQRIDDKLSCVSCSIVPNCLLCDSEADCRRCKEGYYLHMNPRSKNYCGSEKNKCEKEKGFIENTKRVNLIGNCIPCKENCTVCAEGYVKLEDKCYVWCPAGYYLDITGKKCIRNEDKMKFEVKIFNKKDYLPTRQLSFKNNQIFYLTVPPSYDINKGAYRWSVTCTPNCRQEFNQSTLNLNGTQLKLQVNMLEPDKLYTISVQANSNFQLTSDSVTLLTRDPPGFIDSTPLWGYGLDTRFTVYITGYSDLEDEFYYFGQIYINDLRVKDNIVLKKFVITSNIGESFSFKLPQFNVDELRLSVIIKGFNQYYQEQMRESIIVKAQNNFNKTWDYYRKLDNLFNIFQELDSFDELQNFYITYLQNEEVKFTELKKINVELLSKIWKELQNQNSTEHPLTILTLVQQINSHTQVNNLTTLNYNLLILRYFIRQGYKGPLESADILEICLQLLSSLTYSFPESQFDQENGLINQTISSKGQELWKRVRRRFEMKIMQIFTQATQQLFNFVDPQKGHSILLKDQYQYLIQYIDPSFDGKLLNYTRNDKNLEKVQDAPFFPEVIFESDAVLKSQILFVYGHLTNIWNNQQKIAIFSNVFRFNLYNIQNPQKMIPSIQDIITNETNKQNEYVICHIIKLFNGFPQLDTPNNKTKICGMFDQDKGYWRREPTCVIIAEKIDFYLVKIQKSGDYAILTLKTKKVKIVDIYADLTASSLVFNIFILIAIHILIVLVPDL